MAGTDIGEACFQKRPVFCIMLIKLCQCPLDLLFQETFKGFFEVRLFPIIASAIGCNIVDEEQGQRLDLKGTIAEVVLFGFKMPLQGEPEHLLLVGRHVNIDIQFFTLRFRNAVGERHVGSPDLGNGNPFKSVTDDAEGIAGLERKAAGRLIALLILQRDGSFAGNGYDLDLFLFLRYRLKVFFCDTLDQTLIERRAGIEIIQKILIVRDRCSCPAAAYSRLREGGTVTDDALRLQFVGDNPERLLVT